MTERKWLSATSGEALSDYWGERFTKRKAHLLMLACCRRHLRYLRHATLREALAAIAAHFADPGSEPPFESEALRKLYPRVHRIARNRRTEPGRGVAFGLLAAVEAESVAEQLEESPSYLVYSCLHDIAHGLIDGGTAGESEVQAALVREVIGNPFRKVKVVPAWRTDTVLTLARQMYEAEEFGAMPILADALQDAGCDSDPILDHCRDTAQPHVRGCWVIDLLLEKR